MGNSKSITQPKEKHNKNHTRKKGFQVGISFGRGDLSMEGNIQIGWTSRTVKNYTAIARKINDDDAKITTMVLQQETKEEGQKTFTSEEKLDFKGEGTMDGEG